MHKPEANAAVTATSRALRCTEPYEWQAVLGFFRLRAIGGVESASDTHYARTVMLDGEPTLLGVHHDGEQLQVLLTHSDTASGLLPDERLANMFDTRTDVTEVNRTLNADAQLAPVQQAAATLRVAGGWSRFEIIVRAILGQQVTVAAARTLCRRLCAQFGSPLPAALAKPNQPGVFFPGPEVLADADIRGIGVPARRAATLRAAAAAVASGSIDTSTDQADALEQSLLAIHGIGPWTAGYVRMRASKDPDAFPPSDVALLNAARRLGIASNHRELLAAAQRWRPWRAYAAVRLWRWLQTQQ